MSSGGGGRGGGQQKRSFNIVGGIDAEKIKSECERDQRIRLRGEVDKKEKKLGEGDFDEEAIFVLEDAKDCGAIDFIAKGKADSGSAMPMLALYCHFKKTERVCMSMTSPS